MYWPSSTSVLFENSLPPFAIRMDVPSWALSSNKHFLSPVLSSFWFYLIKDVFVCVCVCPFVCAGVIVQWHTRGCQRTILALGFSLLPWFEAGSLISVTQLHTLGLLIHEPLSDSPGSIFCFPMGVLEFADIFVAVASF